ncbi:MAG: glycoside hydrolase 43 family protein [Lachnospiraceae bacterium]|nr:glycoside hydrolase 43 family protein [Lachnospiraceae bacterium]
MKPLWKADLGDGSYRNPILYTDYSDPDAIRVGDDYYMISSSFTYVPGVPVLHSRDMVNWELINYVVREIPFERYDRPAHGAGTWAPALRYHHGTFYAFIPMPDEGIFVSTTKDPAGEWSPMRLLKEASGWIDPCPFWDEDGNAYLVFAYARSRCGIKHRLSICRMDPDAEYLIGEPVLIYDGIQTHPTLEGPKLYKRNGWYYIFAPAGGVPTGWQTVLRSRKILGPYEAKIVMHQGNTEINGPHQGGYVGTPDGKEWFLHFQDKGPYGRISHLQPLCWNGDWPFIGTEQNGDGIGEPVTEWTKPDCRDWNPAPIPSGDNFNETRLGLQWQWQANPKPDWYSLTSRPGALTLFCLKNPVHENALLWYAPNACTQMLQAPSFCAEGKFTLHGSQNGDFISMGILGKQYTYLALEQHPDELCLHLKHGKALEESNFEKACEWEEEPCTLLKDGEKNNLEEPGTVWIRIWMEEGARYRYEYSTDGQTYQKIGGTFQASAACWTGAKFVLYAANSQNTASDGYGCCKYIHFTAE